MTTFDGEMKLNDTWVGTTLFLFLLLFVHIFQDIRNMSIEADVIYGPSR